MNPLFSKDTATLKARLRLTGAAATDALAILDEAVEKVRAGFYDRLGAARIATLQAITMPTATPPAIPDDPTTPDQMLRLVANACEVTWVRRFLVQRLPILFLEGSAPAETWNQEGLTRSFSSSELQREIDRLDAEIEEALSALESGETEDLGDLAVETIGDSFGMAPGTVVNL